MRNVQGRYMGMTSKREGIHLVSERVVVEEKRM